MSFLMVHFVLFKKLLGFYWEGVGFPRLLPHSPFPLPLILARESAYPKQPSMRCIELL